MYVAWRAGRSNRVVVQAQQVGNRLLGSLKGLQIRGSVLELFQYEGLLFLVWLEPY
jgi:hypothetical protein